MVKTMSVLYSSTIIPTNGLKVNNTICGLGTNINSLLATTPVTYTTAQVINSVILRNWGSNSFSNIDYLPTAAQLYAATGNVLTSFTCVIYPSYSYTLGCGTGGVIYGGVLGNSSGFNNGTATNTGGVVANSAQGNSSLQLPNGKCYNLTFILTSSSAYTVLVC
jgi:hypothetical protein